VKILNRGDCCAERLNGAKVYIGAQVFGEVKDPIGGKWATLKGKVRGTSLKI